LAISHYNDSSHHKPYSFYHGDTRYFLQATPNNNGFSSNNKNAHTKQQPPTVLSDDHYINKSLQDKNYDAQSET
jgi:hypothetical protein